MSSCVDSPLDARPAWVRPAASLRSSRARRPGGGTVQDYHQFGLPPHDIFGLRGVTPRTACQDARFPGDCRLCPSALDGQARLAAAPDPDGSTLSVSPGHLARTARPPFCMKIASPGTKFKELSHQAGAARAESGSWAPLRRPLAPRFPRSQNQGSGAALRMGDRARINSPNFVPSGPDFAQIGLREGWRSRVSRPTAKRGTPPALITHLPPSHRSFSRVANESVASEASRSMWRRPRDDAHPKARRGCASAPSASLSET